MISVLMSVYAGEQPAFLELALKSLLNQTVAPDQIILVKDGPLSDDLEAVINAYAVPLSLDIFSLPTNRGLAEALNYGFKHASQPWIMRFDTDDYCVPTRIETQKAMIATDKYDIIGGQAAEFNYDYESPVQTRNLPLQHDQIIQFAKRRNPFNHMAVCFRKSLAVRTGGYPDYLYMEDYALWITMITAGARTVNQPNVVVHARIGNGMLERRGGWKYVRTEWRLQNLMRKLGLKSTGRCLIDGALRSLVFIAPYQCKQFIYQTFLRRAQR